jgi:hypothetical protein
MNFTVTYKPSAEQDLADLWLNALDRQAVTDAANHIDSRLKRDPANQGESRGGQSRIVIEPPLAAIFEVNEADRIVEVLKVSWFG